MRKRAVFLWEGVCCGKRQRLTQPQPCAAFCAAGAQAANAAATASSAAAVQAPPGPGCVLPVLDAMPPAVVQTRVVVEAIETGGSGVPAASAWRGRACRPRILLLKDDDDDEPISRA